MRNAKTAVGITVLALFGVLAVAGCGRKNLPVAPRDVNAQAGLRDENAPSSLANFERSNRVTSGGGSDLRITPAEVARNPGAPKKRFVLDGLLN